MRALTLIATILAGIAGTAAAQDGSPLGQRGRLFISPMGEPFRGAPGGPPPQEQWFDGADANHDGALSVEEMSADGARFFATLDMRHDGEIDPDDIERYETELVPEIRVRGEPMAARGGRMPDGRQAPSAGMRGGTMADGGMAGQNGSAKTRSFAGKQGAGRFGYLDYPEPITVADRNFNRGVDRVEFARAAEARFAMLDEDGDGKLEKSELPKLVHSSGGPSRGGRARDGREDMPPKQ